MMDQSVYLKHRDPDDVESVNRIYTLIAYKPSSEAVSMSCVVASYNSDHIIENLLTEQELIDKLAEIFYENKNFTHGEVGYKTWVLKNGEPIEDFTIHEIANAKAEIRIVNEKIKSKKHMKRN